MASAGPARLFGIEGKGRIALGYDADLTLVDLKTERLITNEWIASVSRWTPYHDKPVTGGPIATVIRGQTVVRDGALMGSPQGQPIKFLEVPL
ncbi:amidohydrolase family protein [Vreelandella venusta]|uniref:amidohydrolase family protein n=1 Tax=Vreelandella venusta TaxID=44935 RepID=UPI0035578B1C